MRSVLCFVVVLATVLCPRSRVGAESVDPCELRATVPVLGDDRAELGVVGADRAERRPEPALGRARLAAVRDHRVAFDPGDRDRHRVTRRARSRRHAPHPRVVRETARSGDRRRGVRMWPFRSPRSWHRPRAHRARRRRSDRVASIRSTTTMSLDRSASESTLNTNANLDSARTVDVVAVASRSRTSSRVTTRSCLRGLRGVARSVCYCHSKSSSDAPSPTATWWPDASNNRTRGVPPSSSKPFAPWRSKR